MTGGAAPGAGRNRREHYADGNNLRREALISSARGKYRSPQAGLFHATLGTVSSGHCSRTIRKTTMLDGAALSTVPGQRMLYAHGLNESVHAHVLQKEGGVSCRGSLTLLLPRPL